MRELKFRMWDKKMLYLDITDIKGVTKELIIEGNFFPETKDRSDWMQYTGLKDKNGKEIYEGDIVKFYPYLNDTEIVGLVEFDNGRFHVINHIFGIYKKTMFDIEVIGNIYENPELLK